MPKVTGFSQLNKRLAKMEIQAKAGKKVIKVGYSAPHAMWVHEMVGMVLKGRPRPRPKKGKYWDPQNRAQAKFLEAPARLLKKTLIQIIQDSLKKGQTLEIALYRAGLRLQRESQLRCPVDTGRLKASAFTKVV